MTATILFQLGNVSSVSLQCQQSYKFFTDDFKSVHIFYDLTYVLEPIYKFDICEYIP